MNFYSAQFIKFLRDFLRDFFPLLFLSLQVFTNCFHKLT